MHQVVEAQRTIAVISPSYLTSAFGGAEWRAVFAKDPTGELGVLLPVRVEEVEPPGLLTTRIYVDLVGKNTLDARAALPAAARGARGKPAEEPELSGRMVQPRGSREEAPRFPGELPPLWNVPYHPNFFFTGRDLLLAELHTKLTAQDIATRQMALIGLGGVGKTQLPVEYVCRWQGDYNLVWWVRGELVTSLLADPAALSDQQPLAADLGLAEDTPQETVVAAVRDWLEHHERWLLVLDNVEDPAMVIDLLARSATGHVVITSRTGVGWERLATTLPIEVLASADPADLLATRTGETGLRRVVRHLSVRVAQTGSTVGVRTHSGHHLVACPPEAAETQPAAVGLLTLAAFLAPDEFPQPLLMTHRDRLPEPLATVAVTRSPWPMRSSPSAATR